MNKDDYNKILMCIATEIDFQLSLEKRGLNLGESLSQLFALREKIKKSLAELETSLI